MKVIGITGGIGTGKSTLLQYLQEHYSAYIMEADKLAHEMMRVGNDVFDEIVGVFGGEILDDDQAIDRTKLGTLVFRQEDKLRKLNEIVHPAVKKHILEDIEKKREEKEIKYYVIEAALLIEDGYKGICDEIWYVYADREERMKRLLHSRGGEREKWEQIMKNQSGEEYYRQHCDVVIDNGKDWRDTVNQVNELLCSTT